MTVTSHVRCPGQKGQIEIYMKYKKVILYTAVGATVASWIVVGAGFAFGVEKIILIIMVAVAAIASEILFWAVAVIFGISVFESRKKIWSWLKSKLRPRKNNRKNV